MTAWKVSAMRYNWSTMTKKSAEVVVPEERDLDDERINRAIRKGLMSSKTVRQMAEETGLKPEEVLRKKTEVLEGVDVLTIQEKRALFMMELSDMSREVRERATNAKDEFYAGMINASTANIKLMFGELTRMEKADTGKVEALNQKRVAELVSLMREVIDVSVVEIAAKYSLDEQDLFDVFNRRMAEAAQKRDLS